MLIVSLLLYCLISGPQRGNYVWHYQCDTFKGYIGEINIYPDYSHKQMSAPWTLSVHLPFKYKRNHLFSPGSNSHVFKISKDIKFLNASNGCTHALARSLGKGIIPFCITYTLGLYFFCFASSQSIFCSHTALKKMGLILFLCFWLTPWIGSNNLFVIYRTWTLCKLQLHIPCGKSLYAVCLLHLFWNEISISSILFSFSYINMHIENLLRADLNVSM